ncbi:hypothetical protein BX616_008960 [Lobosporangium transversale]|nr:hypothetical protein BX616_008960 [Lobosporangium transversale]
MTRNTHDSGRKHKENVERFLREQNQRGKDKEAEKARLNKQMDEIEKAAMKQYQLDVEAGLVKQPGQLAASLKKPDISPAVSVVPSTSSKILAEASADIPSPATDKTSASAEKDTSEIAVGGSDSKLTKDLSVGQPGEWQVVETPKRRETTMASESSRNGSKSDKNQVQGNESGHHYIAGADDDDEAQGDPEDLREFKIVEKTYPTDADLLYEGDGDTAAGDGSAVFKKRKGSSNKQRNIRRKT